MGPGIGSCPAGNPVARQRVMVSDKPDYTGGLTGGQRGVGMGLVGRELGEGGCVLILHYGKSNHYKAYYTSINKIQPQWSIWWGLSHIIAS